MSKITINVFSPWGSTRLLKLGINPKSTIDDLKALLKDELQLEASDLTLELSVPDEDFGRDLVEGTIIENGIVSGSTVNVCSVEFERGTSISKSDSTKKKNLTEEPWRDNDRDRESYQTHSKGLNYEATCPSNPGRKVIIPRGYGEFDYLTDPVDRLCPCCNTPIDPRTVTRAAVNNCEWSWVGILDDGQKLSDSGTTRQAYHWLTEDHKPWRRLTITTIDPAARYKPPPKPKPSVDDGEHFACGLCGGLYLLNDRKVIAGKTLCEVCYDKVNAGLLERQRQREEEIENKKLERREQLRHQRVALPGLGEQHNLKKTPSKPSEY